MVAPVKTQLTIKEQKKRDAWERKIRIAHAHVQSMKNNFNIYKNERNLHVEGYQRWLKDNGIQPIIDINLYK